MKYFALGILTILTIIAFVLLVKPSHALDGDTKRLCMQYALKDHEKEFAPARWEYLKTLGNPNDVEFWYTSCINHHAYPVGGKANDWIK